MVGAFKQLGYAVIPELFSSTECSALVAFSDQLDLPRAGSRNLLNNKWCQDAVAVITRHASMADFLPVGVACAQCTLFRKDPDRNWGVAYHQDLSIPVKQRVEHAACAGWSEKEGVLYVQPPIEVLTRLVAVRVQLDEGLSEAGPLRVLPGTHRLGRISDEQVGALHARAVEVECTVPQGGALALSPLLLHASSKIRGASVRRVLHFLFGPRELPYGLQWHTAV